MLKLNTRQVPTEDLISPEELFHYLSIVNFVSICLCLSAFSDHDFSNLITGGSILNALELYMKNTEEVFSLHLHIIWFTCVQM